MIRNTIAKISMTSGFVLLLLNLISVVAFDNVALIYILDWSDIAAIVAGVIYIVSLFLIAFGPIIKLCDEFAFILMLSGILLPFLSLPFAILSFYTIDGFDTVLGYENSTTEFVIIIGLIGVTSFFISFLVLGVQYVFKK